MNSNSNSDKDKNKKNSNNQKQQKFNIKNLYNKPNNNNNNIEILNNNSIEKEPYNFDDLLQYEKEYLLISKLKKDKQANTCTYNKGYIEQELSFCLTCFEEKKIPLGICVGCANNCHYDHDVINLGFKREFKCDCGNSKFCKKTIFDLGFIQLFFVFLF